MGEESRYVIEMLHITKEFPGIKANDDITLQLKKGEIHALLGENGAGKSTLMSVLFGLYQPEKGEIRKDGKPVKINNPNDATALHIGMVHQHFKLVEVFTVLDNIILGAEDTKLGFLQKKEARKKVEALSEKYGLRVDLDAKVEDITVGMPPRTEILKMLYRDHEILIFDEPTAVLTPQEIDELMQIMKNLTKEGKSILFISHKLNEIMEVSDRVTVLRKGKYVGTVNTKDTNKQELSNMMVGRPVQLEVSKTPADPKEVVLRIKDMSVASKVHKRNAVNGVSFDVRAGEIVCIAGIDGNGQTEFVYGLTGMEPLTGGSIELCGIDISKASIKQRSEHMSHIPEDRHKHGLVLDFTLEENMVLQRFTDPEFQRGGFIRFDEVHKYAEKLIEQYDVRSGQGAVTVARSMSGGNQQQAIIARELDRNEPLVVAVQPTRGLDVGAIEYIHGQLVRQRDEGKAILLISLELEEVMSLSDRILVMYEGEIVGELDPKKTTAQELGLYMSGAKREGKEDQAC
ncbi:MAG: ABC transporter ATP-binding protein [Eubacterium sp.]|nr:ABC transporter ATP-binding protein [Eubacterium sp.]